MWNNYLNLKKTCLVEKKSIFFFWFIFHSFKNKQQKNIKNGVSSSKAVLGWLVTVKQGGQSLPRHHRREEPPVGGPPGLLWAVLVRLVLNKQTPVVMIQKVKKDVAMQSQNNYRRINRWELFYFFCVVCKNKLVFSNLC